MRADSNEDDENPAVLMQQTEHHALDNQHNQNNNNNNDNNNNSGEGDNMGITRRVPLSQSTSAMLPAVNNVKGEDKKLRKSFKDVFSGFFNNTKKKSMG